MAALAMLSVKDKVAGGRRPRSWNGCQLFGEPAVAHGLVDVILGILMRANYTRSEELQRRVSDAVRHRRKRLNVVAAQKEYLRVDMGISLWRYNS